MPREIKTPIRYIAEDVPPPVRRSVQPADSQPKVVQKRGKSRTVGVLDDSKSPSLTSRSVPRKSSESIVIDDDDSDVEIIEAPKPVKRKRDDDPDWDSKRKIKTSRSSRTQDKAKKEKLQAVTSPTSVNKPAPGLYKAPVTTPTLPTIQTSQKSFTVDLYMDCREEPLSLAQMTAMKKEQAQYEMSQSLVKAAREGRLIYLPGGGTKILDKPMAVAPQTPPMPVAQPLIPASVPSKEVAGHFNSQNVLRGRTPDLFIVEETPPKMTVPLRQISPITNTANKVAPVPAASAVTLVQGTYGLGIKLPTGWQTVSPNSSSASLSSSVVAPLKDALSSPSQQKVTHVTPKTITSAKAKVQSDVLAALRQQLQQQAQAKAEAEPQKKKARKHAQLEGDESGNWVPLDEYYYGKMEGDPTYQEIKGEHRFKCWYCNKMLYNNVAAMMHIQGHIDSERQVNLDLSDLTQCKHCYKQFDTPFEMQTHIEKVHMNNTNVLLCRICEKNHDSRQTLKEHMRKFHNACEMPYMCQLCKFRSSMYSDVVDHFKKKHNSSDAMLCMYCLKVFHVRFVNQGWGQTSIFYNHLMKHQVKNSCKKCQLCRLVFLNSGDLKTHKKMDHLPNQKGVIGMNAKYTTPDQVMIKVTEQAEQSQLGGGVKSLNVPAVKKIMEHRLSFPSNVYKVKCIECKLLMGIPDHYKKFIHCSMCRFATSCSFAYSNHMMGFHSGQLTAAASHTPDESKLESKLYCSCGFVSSYGNRIANHLVSCSKSSCFKDPPPPSAADEFGQELQDPRKKPDASLLDVLGLIKKDSIPPLTARTSRGDSPPPAAVDMPEVTLSAKLGRRPFLLRDSLKKAFKNILKEGTDKKLFARARFDETDVKADKQEHKSEVRTNEDQDSRTDYGSRDETVCRNQNQTQTATKDAKLESLEAHVQEAKRRETDEKTVSEDPDIIKQEEHIEHNKDKDKDSSLKLGDEDENDILMETTEERNHSSISASIIDNCDDENLLAENDNHDDIICVKEVEKDVLSIEETNKKKDIENDSVIIEDTENKSAKNVDTERESLKKDDTESESLKKDDTESESLKKGDTERESLKKDDTERESLKKDDTESESLKKDDTERELLKTDNTGIEKESNEHNGIKSKLIRNSSIASNLVKNDDSGSESTKNDGTENKSANLGDIEIELAISYNNEIELTKNDANECESTENDRDDNECGSKNDHAENELTKNDDIKCESMKKDDIGCESTKNDDSECESIKNDDIESESTKNDDIECESTKNDDNECESSKNDIKCESAKSGDIESESTKNDDIEYESTKNDDTECESLKNDDIESESTKNDDIESESTKNDDIESTKNDIIECESTKNDDIECESTKNDDIECESMKNDNTEYEPTKNEGIDSEKQKKSDSFAPRESVSRSITSTFNATSSENTSSIVFEVFQPPVKDYEGNNCEVEENDEVITEDAPSSVFDLEKDCIVMDDTSASKSVDGNKYLELEYEHAAVILNRNIEDIDTNNMGEHVDKEGVDNNHSSATENLNQSHTCEVTHKETTVSRGQESIMEEDGTNQTDTIPTESRTSQPSSESTYKQQQEFGVKDIGELSESDQTAEKQQGTDVLNKVHDLTANIGDRSDHYKREESDLTTVIVTSSQESIFSQESHTSQDSLISQQSSKSQLSEDCQRDGPRAEITQDVGRKIAHYDQESSHFSGLGMTICKELPASSAYGGDLTQSDSSDIKREPSLSSSSRHDRYRGRSRSRSQDRHRERRSKSRDRERNYDRERHRHRDKERHRDHRSRSQERDRHRDRNYGRDQYRDRSRDRNKYRERDRSRERDRKRDQERTRDRENQHRDDRRYR